MSSCSQERVTRILSEKQIYKNSINELDLNLNIPDENTESQKHEEDGVSLSNFPIEIIGTWSKDCNLYYANRNGESNADNFFYSFGKNKLKYGGAQHEVSAEISEITGRGGESQLTYIEKEWGSGEETTTRISIWVESNSMRINGETFCRCRD